MTTGQKSDLLIVTGAKEGKVLEQARELAAANQRIQNRLRREGWE
jgi:hypothetical protein